MKVEKKELSKTQIELNVELSVEEFKSYIIKGAEEISKSVKIDGFRNGKAPLEVVIQKVGEMNVLDHSARIVINKTLEKVIKENTDKQLLGNPSIDITMLSPGNPLKYKIIASFLPNVELGKYKDNNIEAEIVKVTDKEIKKTINTLREQMVSETLVDRKAKKDDKVIVDIDMFVDKVPLEGGQSKDTSVLLGKDYLVKGFDDNIVDSKKGDELNFDLKYPKDYPQVNFAGKNINFKVKVKDVYERKLPAIDGEFMKKFGVKNEKELNDVVRKDIEKEKEYKANQETEGKVIKKIVENSKFDEIPDILITEETKKMMTELEQNITSQGGKFDDYLSSIKKSKEEMEKELLPNAITRVKSALVIREIGIKEGLSVTEEEINQKVEELLNQYKGYEKVEEKIKEPGYRSYLHNMLLNNKIVQKLKDWNIKDVGKRVKKVKSNNSSENKK